MKKSDCVAITENARDRLKLTRNVGVKERYEFVNASFMFNSRPG